MSAKYWLIRANGGMPYQNLENARIAKLHLESYIDIEYLTGRVYSRQVSKCTCRLYKLTGQCIDCKDVQTEVWALATSVDDGVDRSNEAEPLSYANGTYRPSSSGYRLQYKLTCCELTEAEYYQKAVQYKRE